MSIQTLLTSTTAKAVAATAVTGGTVAAVVTTTTAKSSESEKVVREEEIGIKTTVPTLEEIADPEETAETEATVTLETPEELQERKQETPVTTTVVPAEETVRSKFYKNHWIITREEFGNWEDVMRVNNMTRDYATFEGLKNKCKKMFNTPLKDVSDIQGTTSFILKNCTKPKQVKDKFRSRGINYSNQKDYTVAVLEVPKNRTVHFWKRVWDYGEHNKLEKNDITRLAAYCKAFPKMPTKYTAPGTFTTEERDFIKFCLR